MRPVAVVAGSDVSAAAVHAGRAAVVAGFLDDIADAGASDLVAAKGEHGAAAAVAGAAVAVVESAELVYVDVVGLNAAAD